MMAKHWCEFWGYVAPANKSIIEEIFQPTARLPPILMITNNTIVDWRL